MAAEPRGGLRVKESKRWYLLFLPLFAVIGLVAVYPLVLSMYLSLTTANGTPTLANFASMVSTPTFWNALNISLLYSLSSTILAVGIGLGLTFILSQELRGKGVLEVIYILPLAVAPIVVGVLYSPSSVWDDVQRSCTFSCTSLTSTSSLRHSTFLSMFFSEAWEWAPLIMLVALSIVNSMPKDVYEAADLHGASAYPKVQDWSLSPRSSGPRSCSSSSSSGSSTQ